MCWLQMSTEIEAGRRCVVSVVVDVRYVAVIINSELGGLQMTEGIGKITRISKAQTQKRFIKGTRPKVCAINT